MRICIYGAGAMGTSLGMRLKTPCDLVTRNAAHVMALRKEGYPAFLPEEMKGEYDVIFLATRQGENEQIARFLKPFLKEDGALVTVQNGLPEAGLANVLGQDRIYGCALGWGAKLVAPAKVKVSSKEFCLSLGAYGRGDKLEELKALLSPAFEVTVGDLAEIRFAKLTVNAAFSTLSAISGLSFGELAKKHKKLVLALMRETISVAKAAGCKKLIQNGHNILKLFSSPLAGMLLPVAMKKHKGIRSGMLKDLEAGRRCDVDFVAGAAAKEGERLGVPTPKLGAAVALVHDIENGLAELSPESLKLLKDKENRTYEL